jgi:hypothetical protein
VDTTSRPVDTAPSNLRAWRRMGRVAGFVAGLWLLAGTVLYLLDAAGLLGSGPDYHATSAGPTADQATYFSAYFAHQPRIVWDIMARDTILPLAFLALIIVALAVRNRTGPGQPESQVLVGSFIVGGIFSILADLTFLGAAEYWRQTGWPARPATIIVAVGQTVNGSRH